MHFHTQPSLGSTLRVMGPRTSEQRCFAGRSGGQYEQVFVSPGKFPFKTPDRSFVQNDKNNLEKRMREGSAQGYIFLKNIQVIIIYLPGSSFKNSWLTGFFFFFLDQSGGKTNTQWKATHIYRVCTNYYYMPDWFNSLLLFSQTRFIYSFHNFGYILGVRLSERCWGILEQW